LGLLTNRSWSGGKGGGDLGKMGQRININGICSLVCFITNINTLLRSNEVDQLVAVLAHDDRSVVTSNVVPPDALPVLVVHDGQTGLIMELLKTLHGDPNVIVGLDGSLLDTLVVVRLGYPSFSSGAPEGIRVWCVGGGDPGVAGPGPEPAVHIDRLQMGAITPLVLEVALPATGVDRSHIVPLHNFLKHLILSRRVEGDQIHAAISAKVSSIEPVPVLKLVPGFPP